jgi:hypothetical protein
VAVVDGATRLLTVEGVGRTSRVFSARSVTAADGGDLAVYEVPRFVFPYAPVAF